MTDSHTIVPALALPRLLHSARPRAHNAESDESISLLSVAEQGRGARWRL
jgi:hypothetical protein